MKVLITGGCGFLGSNIAAHFLAQNIQIVLVDALFRKGARENLEWLISRGKPHQLRHFAVDLADGEAVSDIVRSTGPFDCVCHLGGQVAMTTSLADPKRDFRTNALGTLNLLEAVRASSPESCLIYSSTNKVYGDLTGIAYEQGSTRVLVPDFPNGFDESLPLDFASPYGCSKGAADQYVRDWHRNFGLKTVVFRHSSIYGGRQFATVDQGWVGWFTQQALRQASARRMKMRIDPFTISGTGKQVRDVLHASDLVRLYQRAWERKDDIAGEIFNIGGGLANSLSLLELFAMLSRLACSGEPLIYTALDRRKSDQDYFVADISKAKRLLDWEPSVSAEEGVIGMIKWIESLNDSSAAS